jgi:hypothetical protein
MGWRVIAGCSFSKESIRADVPAEDVAWALHMFAWSQDIALMAGAEKYVDDGTFRRNLRRMLESFRAWLESLPGPVGGGRPRRGTR